MFVELLFGTLTPVGRVERAEVAPLERTFGAVIVVDIDVVSFIGYLFVSVHISMYKQFPTRFRNSRKL